METPVVRLDEIEPRRVEVGHLRADWTFVGPAAGSVDIGVRRIQIQPGWFSTPLHVHADDEETFFVLAGSGVSVQDDRTYAIRSGDCIVHAEGKEAHTLRAGDDGLDVLAFGVSRQRTSGARLPRVGMTWSGRSWFETGAGKSPFEREAELGPPETPEPAERPGSIVNVDEAEQQTSERENHRGSWRRLGKSAGAKRTGLNLIALEPGQMAAPPHCHSAEEELFVVLEGDGTLLLGEDEHPVSARDVVARPAGTGVAHAFIGRGARPHLPRLRRAGAERHLLLPALQQDLLRRRRRHHAGREARLLGSGGSSRNEPAGPGIPRSGARGLERVSGVPIAKCCERTASRSRCRLRRCGPEPDRRAAAARRVVPAPRGDLPRRPLRTGPRQPARPYRRHARRARPVRRAPRLRSRQHEP